MSFSSPISRICATFVWTMREAMRASSRNICVVGSLMSSVLIVLIAKSFEAALAPEARQLPRFAMPPDAIGQRSSYESERVPRK